MALEKNEQQSLILKKHVNIIHCSNNQTLIQRKLLDALLLNAYEDLPSKSEYEISIKKLSKLIGYNSKDTKLLKNSLLKLMGITYEWNLINPEGNDDKWKGSSVLSAAQFDKGICIYEFSSVMREVLYYPEIYGKIDLEIVKKFKSSYGLALYENAIRFQDLPQTPIIPINVFRKLMGVSEKKYTKFWDFNKRVLTPAIDEVNKLSSISLDVKLYRKKFEVTALQFKISKGKEILKNESENLDSEGLKQIMQKEFGVKPNVAIALLKEHGQEYINNTINLIKTYSLYQEGNIENLAGYLINTLKKKKNEIEKEIVIPQSEKTALLAGVSQIKTKKDVDSKYSGYLRQVVDAHIKTMSIIDKTDLIKEFSDLLETKYKEIYEVFAKLGCDHEEVRPFYSRFLFSRFHFLIVQSMSRQEFEASL